MDLSGDDTYAAENDQYGFAQGSGCGCRPWPFSQTARLLRRSGHAGRYDGNDRYTGASFIQGGSYFLSLGILVDMSGDDRYEGSGSYSCGGGVHLTAGICLDYAGNDTYDATWAGNAVGNDRSTGIFVDFDGDDTYRSKSATVRLTPTNPSDSACSWIFMDRIGMNRKGFPRLCPAAHIPEKLGQGRVSGYRWNGFIQYGDAQ